MSNRITQKQIEALADRINEATGSPRAAWTRNEAGDLRANIGNYHISYAYGGASLHRMSNEYGGVSSVFGYGHVPKRALWDQMHAFLRGIEAASDR